MELGLEGKTVIVTGGGSNIGRGISLAFAKEKCNVVIVEIDEAQGNKTAGEALALGAQGAICVKCNITDPEQVQAMVQKTIDTFGTVDILVNNAGAGSDKLFVDKPRSEWEREINLNLWGPLNCTRAVLDQMVAKKKGSIVSIASDAGRVGEPRAVIYSGCKGAIISISKSLARELGPKYGIRVNAVCPGFTVPANKEHVGETSIWGPSGFGASWVGNTELTDKIVAGQPLRKMCRPEDIANAVLYLASDVASGHVTGQTISTSGGFTMA